ncbi:Peroxisome chaperone and import receptor [Globisporangium polare]
MSSAADDEHKREEEEIDLDDLLDDALDDFNDELSTAATAAATPLEVAEVRDEAAATLRASEESEIDHLKDSMSKFLEDAQNPEFQEVLEQAFRELGTSADGESIESLLGSLKTGVPAAGGDDEDDVSIGVAKTLQNMSKAAEDMEGMETAQLEEMGEEMMEEMMKKFEQMGEKSDFQDLVDGMMQQLLSKDVMYDPMLQICERYPEWLAEKESLLSKEDYERYGKQYQYFQQIIAVYESEPDNFARLSELMQEMQETGQPPSEIVKDLAPGLQFDDEGNPVMPNMGAGMFPGMAGMPGGMPGGEQCSLM